MRKTVFFCLLVILLAFGFIGCDNGGNGATTYTVTFNTNGGSKVAKITGITSGLTIILPKNPIKEGNYFGGWYTDNETFRVLFSPQTTAITENITLYARWYSWIPSPWAPPNAGNVSSLKQLSDNRFNGVFIGTKSLQNIGVLYENRLVFDGTNRSHYFSATSRNGVLQEEPCQVFFEIEIGSNGKYRRRLWDNHFSNWTEWLDYEFISGERLMIQWYEFYTLGDGVYNKYGVLPVLNQNTIGR